MKRRDLFGIFIGLLLMQAVIYVIWNIAGKVPPEIQPGGESSELLINVASKFIESNNTISLSSLGGLAATLFLLAEKFRITPFRAMALVASLSFFSGALFFGYCSFGILVREVSDVGSLQVDAGSFHVASSLQLFSVLAGAISYALVILDLIYSETLKK